MKFTRWFKVNGSNREFMYLDEARTKQELQSAIKFVKEQGDLYRITRNKAGRYTIWDARP